MIDEQYEVQNSSTIGGSSRDLDAERIHAIRGGSVINLPDLLVAGDSLQIRTTLFQNRIKDEIFRTRSVGCASSRSTTAVSAVAAATCCR